MARLAGDHLGEHGADAVDRAVDVQPQDLNPRVDGHGRRARREPGSGVRDHQVDGPEASGDVLRRVADGPRVGHVCDGPRSLSSRRFNLRRQRRQQLAAPRDEAYRPAAPSELLGERVSDAGGCTGDESYRQRASRGETLRNRGGGLGGARPVAFKVEGDAPKALGSTGVDDPLAHARLDHLGDLAGIQLDARMFFVDSAG